MRQLRAPLMSDAEPTSVIRVAIAGLGTIGRVVARKLADGMPGLALAGAAEVVLERVCRPMLEAGKRVMVLSAGALLPRPELIELAKARGGQIIVPTGALLGLDAMTAAAEGQINSVRMITRKP